MFQGTGAADKHEHITYAPGSSAARANERQCAYLCALARRKPRSEARRKPARKPA